VLIGGPPCQAYSLAGRSRNCGIKNYSAEKDHRNFLYREYLEVIARFKPSVFVMENVKGLLSAKIDGAPIFPQIVKDLHCPGRALFKNNTDTEYDIFSLTTPSSETTDLFNDNFDPRDFIIRAENYGIPQARHRVILLGIRKDVSKKSTPNTLTAMPSPTVKDVISDLPPLRSGLSKGEDTLDNWSNEIHRNIKIIIRDVKKIKLDEVAERMTIATNKIGNKKLKRGSNWLPAERTNLSSAMGKDLQQWYRDPAGWTGVCNHETRGHITTDLHRYLFCACYSQTAKKNTKLTPKAKDFPVSLAPNHANWNSGNFSDRFRVQSAHGVATTITSHISKDGHYFIHYDPTQCRSLTVREAARIQTFPDNYFFVGNRTQQYVQVGNAVPPCLARQIAKVIHEIIK
jgi:DNA (cytosine-5)-methyltransferase 1